MKKRIGILTGGGDVPPLNAALCAAKNEAQKFGSELIGFLEGWKGVLEGKFIDLIETPIDPRIGGTILKSSRANIAHVEDGPRTALSNLKEVGIDGLIVIGGEDTLSNCFHLGAFPQVLIAKTIDNDVGRFDGGDECYRPENVMNFFTLGYPTAAEKIASYVSLESGLRTTAYSHERIIIVESMGMHAGWLALASGLGHPDFIIVPEFPLVYASFLNTLIEKYERLRHLVIVVAEGAKWEDGTYLYAEEDDMTGYDHPRFGGAAEALKARLKKDLDGRIPTRNINAVNPSYLYRSGAPNRVDALAAMRLGKASVRLLQNGLDESCFLWLRKGRRGLAVKASPLRGFASVDELHRFVDSRFYDPVKLSLTGDAERYLRDILRPGRRPTLRD